MILASYVVVYSRFVCFFAHDITEEIDSCLEKSWISMSSSYTFLDSHDKSFPTISLLTKSDLFLILFVHDATEEIEPFSRERLDSAA